MIRSLMMILLVIICCVAPVSIGFSQVIAEIEVRNTPNDDDDYLCWTPINARIRLASNQQNDVDVELRSVQLNANSGSVQFLAAGPGSISPSQFSPSDTLSLTLPASQEWVAFKVAGRTASVGSKDILIRSEVADGSAVAQLPVMVRVRKNAQALTATERDAFLDALVRWKAKPGLTRPTRFDDYYTAHDDAFQIGIHTTAATPVNNFLPWHRAFLMSLERELQEFDRTVTLPYWKFDEPPDRLFDDDFIGVRTATSTVVQFSATNPIQAWTRRNVGELVRLNNWDQSAPIASRILPIITCTPAVPNDPNCPDALGIYSVITGGIESAYHNTAHGGAGGWLGRGTSPSDPLFFLLHANVDRAWAHWQTVRDRFVGTRLDEGSYTPTGQYPGPGTTPRNRESIYALDQMWPWGEKSGDGGTPGDDLDDWPPYRFLFPSAPGLPFSASSPPTPATMIDYMGINDNDVAHSVCYDDMNFVGSDPR